MKSMKSKYYCHILSKIRFFDPSTIMINLFILLFLIKASNSNLIESTVQGNDGDFLFRFFTNQPTRTPSSHPEDSSSLTITSVPTKLSTDSPTFTATQSPSDSVSFTSVPTKLETDSPTFTATQSPSDSVSSVHTKLETDSPTFTATQPPTISNSSIPTEQLTYTTITSAPTIISNSPSFTVTQPTNDSISSTSTTKLTNSSSSIWDIIIKEKTDSPTSISSSISVNSPEEYPKANVTDILTEATNPPTFSTAKPTNESESLNALTSNSPTNSNTSTPTNNMTDALTSESTYDPTSIEYPTTNDNDINQITDSPTSNSTSGISEEYPTANANDISIDSTNAPTLEPSTNPFNVSLAISNSSHITWDSSNKCVCTTLTEELNQPSFTMAIDLYLQNQSKSEEVYGEIECWNTGKVDAMAGMIYNEFDFNADISCWNTSSVTDMSSMFWNAKSFNVDISNWDVSNVETMTYMFFNASSFNQDLNTWNVSKSKSFHFMFPFAIFFNQSLCWDVAEADALAYNMFDDAYGCLVNDTECCPTCIPEGSYPYCD